MILKKEFPILQRKINGKEIAYLDSGATSLKPKVVIDAVSDFYNNCTANIHRGIYSLSEEATEKFEKSREEIASLINCKPEEIIFTKSTTEGINFISHSFKSKNISVSLMEHHSNFLPWKLRHNLQIASLNKDLTINPEDLSKKIKKSDIISLPHISNFSGIVNPVEEISREVHEKDKIFVLDAAQSVPHIKVNLRKINPDFFVFSGHKMLGPSGVGVVYGKEELLEKLNPVFPGGGTVKNVSLSKIEWNDLPLRFEAGTPNIEGVIGFGEAVRFLKKYGMKNIEKHEQKLTNYFWKRISEFKKELKLKVYGPKERAGIFSFNLKDIHAHDVSSLLDTENIFLRAGHHCTGPLHKHLKIAASLRASFYIYNEKKDIDRLFSKLREVRRLFK